MSVDKDLTVTGISIIHTAVLLEQSPMPNSLPKYRLQSSTSLPLPNVAPALMTKSGLRRLHD